MESAVRSIKHYSNFHQILLVGEGDFSFSLALANAFGSAENMVPTSLNSKEKLLQMYTSAHETLQNLEKLGATVLHGVDARTMEKHHIIRKMRFHRIVFNFPHAGFHGPEYHKNVIKKHRDLLKMFFTNSRTMLSEIGEIHVTHQENSPYKMWELVKQAEDCGLLFKDSVHFTIADYPGYTNRKGAGRNAGRTFRLGNCRTYKFVLGPEILYKRKLCAIQVVLSNVSSEESVENFETAILKLESQRQQKMAGEMRKEDSEASSTLLEMLLNEEINTSDEFARQMTETLHQMAQAGRVKEKIAEQLDEALDENDRKEARLTDVTLELESERGARKVAAREKDGLKNSLNSLKLNLNKELEKNAELKRQRDEAFLQREEACREKSKIAEQLNEALDGIKGPSLELQSATQDLEVILTKEFKRNNELEKQIYEAFLQRKAAETEKADLERSLNNLKVSLSNEFKRNNELERQRDAGFLQLEKCRREKTSIATQLDEALAKDAAKKRDEDSANNACGGFCFVFFILCINACGGFCFVFFILCIIFNLVGKS